MPDLADPVLVAVQLSYDAALAASRPQDALALYLEGLSTLEAQSNTSATSERMLLRVRLKVGAANHLGRMSQFSEALLHTQEALELLEAIQHAPVTLEIMLWAELYAEAQMIKTNALRFLGRLDESLHCAEVSLNTLEELPVTSPSLQVWRVRFELLIASVYYHQGDLLTALRRGLVALDLAQSIGDAVLEMRIFHHLASVTFDRQELEAARDYYQRSLDLAIPLNQAYFRSQTLTDLAETLLLLKASPEQVGALLDEALNLSRELNNRTGEAYALLTLGRLTVAQLEGSLQVTPERVLALHTAVRCYHRALHIYQVAHSQLQILECHAELGKLHTWLTPRRPRSAQRAETNLRTALALVEQVGAHTRKVELLQQLSTLYEHQGRFPEALEQQKAFHEAYQAVSRLDSEKHIRSLQLQHAREEAQMHRQHSATLTQVNAELEARGQALLLADRERNTLLIQLEHLASTDALTGLLNRRTFVLRLEQAFGYAQTHDAPLSVLMCDADHFKRVNDTYGHAVGDRVLQILAEVFLRHLRRKDAVIARYGGEEFVIVLPDTDTQAAAHVAERLRAAVEQFAWSSEVQQGLTVTLSLGVATSGQTQTADALVRQADSALYAAKHAGRNQVKAYSA